jgi:hypothetical protein
MKSALELVNSSLFREIIYDDRVTPWWTVNENSITIFYKDPSLLLESNFIEFSEEFDTVETNFDGYEYQTTLFVSHRHLSSKETSVN